MRAQKFRFSAALMALIMVMTFMVIPLHADAQRFKDVPPNRWYYEYVENLASKKIVGGFGSSGEFRPDNKVERQHVAKMVTVAAGLSYKGKKANFPDVPPSNEMSPFIAALQEKGAIGGYKDGTFGPQKNVTRAEISVIIAKAFDLKAYGQTSSLKDLKGHWAEGLVKILISNGIVKGYADGTFRPNNPVTRAELSKMLSVAMAVSAVQKAETSKSQTAARKAQDLVNALPKDQDLESRYNLENRLFKAILPDKTGGWYMSTDIDYKTGLKMTIHYSVPVYNYNDYQDTELVMPFYVKVENIGSKDLSFYRFYVELINSSGEVGTYDFISRYSSLGEMNLKELESVDLIPGGKTEGYLFFVISEDVVPVRLRYKTYTGTQVEFFLD